MRRFSGAATGATTAGTIGRTIATTITRCSTSYYDPFGWGYQPYSIGWRMWPSYYRSNYWLNDPGQYRLPYAPPGTRWIRYYDDAILIDMWSGQVVDVIYNFFW